jgi:CO/xanthine dehydrogenase FAD-binding subunit
LGGVAPCYAIEGDHRFHHAVIDGHRCQATTPSDLATVFRALDAELVLVSRRGERRLPIGAFYTGPGETVLAADELIRAIRLPAVAGRLGAFAKLRLYEGDFAIVSAAVTAVPTPDGWRHAHVVLGGVAPVAWRSRAAENAIETGGDLRKSLDAELDAHAHPLRRNAWKLDAAAGIAEEAFERLTSRQGGR